MHEDQPALDLHDLREVFEDDHAGIVDLLQVAQRGARENRARLRDAVGRSDLAAIRAAAHSIKGALGNVGARESALVAGQIEEDARDGTLDGIPALLDRLDGALARFEASLAAYRASFP